MRGKWTEGPWSLAALHSVGMYPNDGSVVILSANSVDPVHVAAVAAHAEFKRGQGHNLTNDPERDANARLIAAAPALYDALETACEIIADLSRFANGNGAMIDDETFPEGLAALSLAHPQPKGEEA